MIKTPIRRYVHCGSVPASLNPSPNTPTVSAPNSMPNIEPRPPKSEMPPITTAVMLSMFASCPEVGDTEPIRPISTQPASAQIRPASTYAEISVRRTRTPASSAAPESSPIA